MKKRIFYPKTPSYNPESRIWLFVLLLIMTNGFGWSQTSSQTITVTGTVIDAEAEQPVAGANVIQQGTSNGVMTDFDGNYTIEVPGDATLVISFLGFKTQVIEVGGRTEIDVVLAGEASALEEVVVVGYGTQKKESVVGSIVQVKGEKLLQSGGVSTVGQALTGRLPGVTTIASSGRPGEESPDLFIRGRSTWNGSGQPLVLVDGIERSLNDINANDIESISVLKDASATAVFGVKGANGVILITSKRGKIGKAQLSLTASSTVKTPSKIPSKFDSYNGILAANESIERTVPVNEETWLNYVPFDLADRYRNPRNETDTYVYPNVDWIETTQKDFALDHQVNLSVSGGTEIVKYFGAINYNHVGDIYDGDAFDTGRGYTTNYDYNRFNFRSNIDFDVTKSTRLSVNLSGYYGVQNGADARRLLLNNSIYELSPDLYFPLFPDDTYGNSQNARFDITNPAVLFTADGDIQQHRVQINSDFILNQDLNFVTEGLSFKGQLSFDNNFRGNEGVVEPNLGSFDNVIYRIYEDDGSSRVTAPPGVNQFDFVIQPWTRDPLEVDDNQSSRRLFYQLSINYARTFAEKHNLTILALMSREEFAVGNMFPRYREDWVGRFTYNYDSRYFLDVNGAYNGSEKYGPGFKFDLFPSIALGWMVSNEGFMDGTDDWLDKLKLRGSYGIVGDDSAGQRYGYLTQWDSGGRAFMNNSNVYGTKSPYVFYREAVIGNPNLQWETSEKLDLGFELALFKNMISLDFDYFKEDRDNIIIPADQRSVPSFFGFRPPDVNLGKTTVEGVEVVLNFKKQLTENWNVYADAAYTRAVDEVVFKEDPLLKEDYQKAQGFPIDQGREKVRGSILASWDDVYASAPREANMGSRRPGFYDELDWNMDGVVNGDDNVPFGYTNRPQNTFNLTLGAGYKKFDFMIQFYGVNNASKRYIDRTFIEDSHLYFDFLSDYWSKSNPDGEEILTGFGNTPWGTDPYRAWYDSSFLRLQNVEFAYTFDSEGRSQYRVYLSGNNLAFWSDLPDDRMSNAGNQSNFRGDYPIFRRINLGVTINF